MTDEELQKILNLHKKWLNNEDGGVRANLYKANLQELDLRGADLRRAYLWKANLQGVNLCKADLRDADLSGVNFYKANLYGSDLRGADIDYLTWPLWCSSLDVKVDKHIMAQLAYHFCRLVCDDPEVIAAQNALVPLANQFHKVEECGEVKLK